MVKWRARSLARPARARPPAHAHAHTHTRTVAHHYHHHIQRLQNPVGQVELLAEMVEEREVLARGFTRLVSSSQESQRAKGEASDGPGFPPSNPLRFICWKVRASRTANERLQRADAT